MAKDGERSEAAARKAEILSGWSQIRGEILDAASALPTDSQEVPFVGVWTAKDLLAHLIGWDYANLQAAEEILQGQVPSFYEHQDRDWATFNALLIDRYGREEMDEVLRSLRDSHEKLLEYMKDLPPEEFWADRGVRHKGYRVIIGRLMRVEWEDEKEHLEQIRQFATEGAEGKE
jgi:hypothetical protein